MTLARGVAFVAMGWQLGNAQDTGSVRDAGYYFVRALAADSARDVGGFLRAARESYRLAPQHPSVVFLLARGYVKSGQHSDALALLDRASRMGDTRRIEDDSTLAPLRGRPEFRRVAERFAHNRTPVASSTVAFTIDDPDLIPEALAFDSTDGSFLVGSLWQRKVVRVMPNGSVRDFIGPAPDILRVVGIKIDRPRNRVWFATWAPAIDTASSAARRVDHTRLFVYDLTRGTRLATYAPSDTLRAHLLNDLVVTTRGDVYVTDTQTSNVYRVRAGVDTLELFASPDQARYGGGNGITLSANERTLYVAYAQGVAAIDIASRRASFLAVPDSITTAGIDGVYRTGSSLVAVQTAPPVERVIRFDLDATGLRITRARILERGNPIFHAPTTGILVGRDLYYIPNSYYDRQTDDGKLNKAEGDVRTRVMKVRVESLSTP